MFSAKKKLLSLTGATNLATLTQKFKDLEKLVKGVMIEDFFQKHLFENPRYDDPRCLSRHYQSVFSQNGEDGIIREIFNRIGHSNKFFVEFGAHGFDNNTTLLLHKGWKGIWIEGDEKRFQKLQSELVQFEEFDVTLKNAFITAECFEEVLEKSEVPKEFDLLSIDIDGMDYYVFAALQRFRPRVVIIEYNSSYGPSDDLVVDYDPAFQWQGDSYFGASLKALQLLGNRKGYVLVGCDFSGCNAFFVREDLVGDQFLPPFTSESHFEPPRYYVANPSGHWPAYGKFNKDRANNPE